MRRVFLLHVLMVIAITFAAGGCRSHPITPDVGSEVTITGSQEQSRVPNHFNLGTCLVEIDTTDNSVEVLPLRSSELHINLTKVFVNTMGLTIVLIPGESDPDNGLFALDFTLTHPFDLNSEFTAFDIKGIVMSPGTMLSNGLLFSGIDETRLENADGYTRWWNPTEFPSPGLFGYTDGLFTNTTAGNLTATVNPYKYFADILGPTDDASLLCSVTLDNPIGRGLFSDGASNTRRYRLRFPMDPDPVIVFGYVIDGCWDLPDPNPPFAIPGDFPIEANQCEAYNIEVTAPVNLLYYDSEVGAGGGILRVRADVYDWQGQDAGDISGQVAGVNFYVPTIASYTGEGDIVSQTGTYATYAADLTPMFMPTEAGEALLVCAVRDAGGFKYKQGSEPAPDVDVTAYQVVSLDVIDPECFVDANNSFSEAINIDFGDEVTDQFCNPDDPEDFYTFEIPQGCEVTGNIRLWANSEPLWPVNPQLIIYDSSQSMLHSTDVLDGAAVLPLHCLELMPGQYYLKVVTTSTDQVIPYLLELDAELENVAPDNPVEVTPSTLFVDPEYVWIAGDYALLLGMGLWVYDVSDTSNPSQVYWELFDKIPQYSCFSFPYCYYTCHTGSGSDYLVNLIDFSEPGSPVVHENVIAYSADGSGISCMDSTHLYLQTGAWPNYDIEIYRYWTDPLNPVYVASIPLSYQPHYLKLTEYTGFGTYLLVGTFESIHGYWVEDLGSITEYTPYPITGGTIQGIATDDNFCYLAVDKGTPDGWLYVLSLEPGLDGFTYYGSVDIPGSAEHIELGLPYAYIADGGSGLTVCNVSVPTLPDYLGSTHLVSDGTNLTVDGDTVCIVPENAGLQIFDVSVPAAPDQLARLKVVNHPSAINAFNDYLFATEYAGSHQALKTIDISDPSNAHVVDEYLLTYGPWYMDRKGNILVLASNFHWMIFDVGDPLDLTYLNTLAVGGKVTDIGIYGDAVYISTDTPDVKVFDISNLPSVSSKPSFIPPATVIGFEFTDDIMYLNSTNGIDHYNITDPFNPIHTGTYHTTPSPRESVFRGKYLYTVTESTVNIAELNTPVGLSFVSDCNVGALGSLDFIDLEGQFVYVCGYSEQPSYACGVWPPDSPYALGALHDVELPILDLEVHNGYLYEANPFRGVQIYDLY